MSLVGRFVIVRTYAAGVHFGKLASQAGKEATLTSAGRIWKWCGANTLHEIALKGVGSGSRVSLLVEEIILTDVIEIIAGTEAAAQSLTTAGWA